MPAVGKAKGAGTILSQETKSPHFTAASPSFESDVCAHQAPCRLGARRLVVPFVHVFSIDGHHTRPHMRAGLRLRFAMADEWEGAGHVCPRPAVSVAVS